MLTHFENSNNKQVLYLWTCDVVWFLCRWLDNLHSNKRKMAPKFAKALIGGNWKCNGTVSSIRSMAEVLNKAGNDFTFFFFLLPIAYVALLGPFSAQSEVVIAAPSIHLTALRSILRSDIALSSQVLRNIENISLRRKHKFWYYELGCWV